MASPKALITPSLLVWAREKCHLSPADAAKRLGVTQHKLESWEAGIDFPTMKQLYEISHLYRRPLSLFYLKEPPRHFSVATTDFRRLSLRDSLPYELVKEIQFAQERQAVAAELLKEAQDLPPKFPHLNSIELNSTVEEAGRQVREWLGINLKTQTLWRDRYEAFRAWRKAVEEQDVLVFQTISHKNSLPPEVASGFSLRLSRLPAIVINGRDPIRRRIFTLIHELVHLGFVVKEDSVSICDTLRHDPREGRPIPSVEARCNAIAGSVLVPEAPLLRQSSQRTWPEQSIRSLAGKFKVSREVIIRRLLEFDLITYDFYREKSSQYKKEWRDREGPAEDFRPSWARRYFNANGPAFSRIVFDAYGDNRISLVEVASFLGTRANHLPEIQRLAGSQS